MINKSQPTIEPGGILHLKIASQGRNHFGLHLALCASLLLTGRGSGLAAELAGLGSGIMGCQTAVDSTPGIPRYGAGLARNINDGDPSTRVDNFGDGVRGVSFVGIVWPTLRYEQIGSATLTLAAFLDGGWFGPNGVDPGPGGTLTAPAYLTAPTVQVSTNRGSSWQTVNFSTDYLTALNGASIGGGTNPNPNPLTVSFTFSPPLTNVNGLRIIGPNGGRADGNGFLGVFELSVQGTAVDNDMDGMPDVWEQAFGLSPAVNDAAGDLDSDGLPNDQEYLAGTAPNNPDCDGDGYSDGVEVANGSNPNDPNSIPGNLARQGIGILGVEDMTGFDIPIANAGSTASINDGDLTSHVDTWNNTGTEPLSYVGITWMEPQTNGILRLELTLTTFWDGGWFGPNNRSPGPGGTLNATYLAPPNIQVSPDGGVTWTNVTNTSDYFTALNGHGIGGGLNPNPTFVTATFIINPPVANVYGVRIIGPEGGVASRGFLGVSELKVYARTDSDSDGMDDDWERSHGLIIGVNDAAGDADHDGLSNLQEFLLAADPQNPDTDGDGLSDGSEVNTNGTNPLSPDSDNDGLNDGPELNTYHTNPLVPDSDNDGFPDGLEAALGSDPATGVSIPSNLALRNDAQGLLGTAADLLGSSDTPVFNAGSSASINDGNLATVVDSYNPSPDPFSFVGILWTNSVTNPVARLELNLATFFDGGWFGPNNMGPGAGGVLTAEYLTEPTVQVTSDGGLTWANASFTSDYLTAVQGHALPAVAYGPPTRATARFQLNPPKANINGIRIIGSEGGTASSGFLGVFELAVLVRTPQPVMLLNPRIAAGQFRFDFDSETGATYLVQYKTALSDATWQTLASFPGDGTRKPIGDTLGTGPRFYRVMSQ